MILRIALVDDQEMYRLGFRMLLETQEEVEVVGEADDVAARLHELAERWGAEELLVVTYAHDAAARRRSYELLARAW